MKNKNLKIGLSFLVLVFVFSIFAPSAHAGFVVHAPSYLGLSSGLVGCWTFDGSYTKAPDCSGNNNTGTLTNGPTRATGKIGQALNFDGSNDVVNAGSGSSLGNLSALTLSAWVKAESFGESGQGYILDKTTSIGPVNGWAFQVTTTGSTLQFAVDYDETNLLVTAVSNTIELNKWIYFALTWDGSSTASNVHIYKNGAEVSSYGTQTNASGNRNSDASASLRIGEQPNGLRAFDGSLDDVRIYNRVLSAAEVKRLYLTGVGVTK